MPAILILIPVIFAFALMSLKLFNSLRTMQIRMGAGVVLSRYESPLMFWAVIAIQGLIIGTLLGIIYFAILVLPNQVMS